VIHSVPQAKKAKAKAKIPTDDAVGRDSVLACLAQWAKEKKGSEPLAVAVVGVTNVSIIDPLAFFTRRMLILVPFCLPGDRWAKAQ